MSMNGFFVAVPERQFFEFCQSDDPDAMPDVIRWDVADAFGAIHRITWMTEYFSAEMRKGIQGLNAADGVYSIFTPDRVDAFGQYLEALTFEEVTRWLNSNAYDADSIYHGQRFVDDPEALFKHVNLLKNMLQKLSPIYDPAINRHTNAYVVIHYIA